MMLLEDYLEWFLKKHSNKELNGVMDDIQYIKSPDGTLQHYGVKGMKWGIRRYQPYPKGEGHKGAYNPAQATRSLARNVKATQSGSSANVSNMSDKELKTLTDRLRKENDLQRLTRTTTKGMKNRAARKDRRKLYRNREKLSDAELDAVLKRYNMEQNYQNQAALATKTHKVIAREVILQGTKAGIKVYKGDVSGAALDVAEGILRTVMSDTGDSTMSKGEFDDKMNKATKDVDLTKLTNDLMNRR